MRDDLGDRMKGYEAVAKRTFIKRMPVIIRLDGKSFSKLTKPLKKNASLYSDPFHPAFAGMMIDTMNYLCENIQNVAVGYTQSDEITLVLNDWKQFTSQQWFGGSQSKIESVAAGMASAKFTQAMIYAGFDTQLKQEFAVFDARAFNIPKEDVTNNFIWRQQDCIRNSVSMLAQYHFSHKELQGISCRGMKEKLKNDKGIIWDDLEPWKRNGTMWRRDEKNEPCVVTFKENRALIEDELKTDEGN